MSHTPTPWKRYDSPLHSWIANSNNGKIVCDEPEIGDKNRWESNAAHIVRCVNVHDQLVAAVKLACLVMAKGAGLSYKDRQEAHEACIAALAAAEKGA